MGKKKIRIMLSAHFFSQASTEDFFFFSSKIGIFHFTSIEGFLLINGFLPSENSLLSQISKTGGGRDISWVGEGVI